MRKIIDTKCGIIEGISENGICCFKGIPYAKAERFHKPIVIEKYDEPIIAIENKDACIQKRTFINATKGTDIPFYQKEFWNGLETKYSENCHNLNIWFPENKKDCPVLIIIYGGGNIEGQANEFPFDGSKFAEKGIVTVIMNYRLGIFGFFTTKELDKKYGSSGNYTLYDQMAAIEWVKRNIKSFNGDPNHLVLIGQSAGASSVETLIRTPMNKNIFKGAIMQSSAGYVCGLPVSFSPTKEKVQSAWQEIVDNSGCKSLDEFLALPVDVLFNLTQRSKNGFLLCSNVPDDVFAEDLRNNPVNINCVCGFTADDTATYLNYYVTEKFKKAQQDYGKCYGYYFDHPLPGDDKGCWHGCDLWYTYGALHNSWRPFTAVDQKISTYLQDNFVSFIKTGMPLSDWTDLSMGDKYCCFTENGIQMQKLNKLDLIKRTIIHKGPRA